MQDFLELSIDSEAVPNLKIIRVVFVEGAVDPEEENY